MNRTLSTDRDNTMNTIDLMQRLPHLRIYLPSLNHSWYFEQVLSHAVSVSIHFDIVSGAHTMCSKDLSRSQALNGNGARVRDPARV